MTIECKRHEKKWGLLFTLLLGALNLGFSVDGRSEQILNHYPVQYAEEFASGKMYLDSSDLELGLDEGLDKEQIVSLRYSKLNIPRGARIKEAYLQFEVDESSQGAISLEIYIQRTSHSAEYTDDDYNISRRQWSDQFVEWRPKNWLRVGDMGLAQRTPNLAGLISSITNQEDWNEGHSISLLIKRSSRDDLLNYRVAENDPELYVSFSGSEKEPEKPEPEPDPEPVDPSTSVNYRSPGQHDYPSDYHVESRAPKRHLVTWLEDPSTEARISWGVDRFGIGNHDVYLSTQPHFGELERYELQFDAKESGLYRACGYKSKHANLTAEVKGLLPNTTYYYVVVSAGQRSKELHFVTAPKSRNVAFKFFSGGDSRSDRSMRRTMNRMMQDLIDKDQNYITLIHGGDFVSRGSSCADWYEWIEDHQETITPQGRVIPIIPTVGNHEYYRSPKKYGMIFGKVNDYYYVSTLGLLSMVILNSEISTEGAQKSWLNQQLNKLNQIEGQFVVAGYHRPAFPAVKNPGRTKSFIPLFERYNVDFVFESDGHALKQTCRIRENSCRPDGIYYVGEGGLGVPQRTPKQRSKWYFDDDGYAMSKHHIQSISVEPQSQQFIYEVFYDGDFRKRITLSPNR